MYVGHFGLALLGKGLRREMRLWTFIVAVFSPDLVEAGVQLVLGRDPQELWSHSLAGALLIAAVLGLLYLLARRDLVGAGFVAAAALSHWGADFLTGRVSLWPGGPAAGLNLYDHPVADFCLEVAVVLVGWLAYRRTLPAARRTSWAAWAILVGLAAFQVYFNFRGEAIF